MTVFTDTKHAAIRIHGLSRVDACKETRGAHGMGSTVTYMGLEIAKDVHSKLGEVIAELEKRKA